MSLSFAIGRLLGKPQGSREKFDFKEPLAFDESDGLILKSPVSGKVECLKLPHEINVQIRNLKADAELQCSRCLKVFVCPISVPLAEREFIIDLEDRQLEEGEEVFYVEKGKREISLYDMIREEILLHFPGIPICSEGCKGLCDRCGTDLNEKNCNCK